MYHTLYPPRHALLFWLVSIWRNKFTAAFNGGLISSDSALRLLAGADRRFGPILTLAAIIPDHCAEPDRGHPLSAFATACGYPKADDRDDLRKKRPFLEAETPLGMYYLCIIALGSPRSTS